MDSVQVITTYLRTIAFLAVGVAVVFGYWLNSRRRRSALLRLGKRAEDAAQPKVRWERVAWISLLLAVCGGNFLLLGLMDIEQFQNTRLLIVGIGIAAAVWLALLLVKDSWHDYFHWDRIYAGKKPQLTEDDDEADADFELPPEVRAKRPRRPSRVRRAEPYKPG